jgi:hypothetical protein
MSQREEKDEFLSPISINSRKAAYELPVRYDQTKKTTILNPFDDEDSLIKGKIHVSQINESFKNVKDPLKASYSEAIYTQTLKTEKDKLDELEQLALDALDEF